MYFIGPQCEISSDDFLTEYSAVVRGLGIVDPQTGQSCSLEELQAAQQGKLVCPASQPTTCCFRCRVNSPCNSQECFELKRLCIKIAN